jgi:hypothetical protein
MTNAAVTEPALRIVIALARFEKVVKKDRVFDDTATSFATHAIFKISRMNVVNK